MTFQFQLHPFFNGPIGPNHALHKCDETPTINFAVKASENIF